MQMTIGDVQQHMQDLVPARFFPLSKALAEVDYARIGVIAKEDFREIINKHIIRLNSEQVLQYVHSYIPTQEFHIFINCEL